MNKLFSSLLLFLLVANYGFAQQPAATPNKYALIVAVGQYDPRYGINSISSANDVPLIKSALLMQGFKEENILVLLDAKATKKGIVKAFETHLINKAKPGDAAFFHVSSHGQQVMDLDGDEVDGYDESILPYDTKVVWSDGSTDDHMLDEEMGALLDKLRTKLGPKGSVLVTIDACHSGTGTRGDVNISRGIATKYAPEAYIKANANKKPDNNGLINKKAENKDMAPMVSFFGSSANEVNYETLDDDGNHVGSLSYAVCKAFAKCTSKSTYRGIFDNVRTIMASCAPRQTPQVEGDINRTVLGGNVTGIPDHFTVKKIYLDSVVTVNAGLLAGFSSGSTVSFYPADTKDPSKAVAIATGVVKKAEYGSCTVNLSKKNNGKKIMASWAVIKDQGFGDIRLSVRLNIKNEKFKKDLGARLGKVKSVTLSNDKADLLIEETGPNTMQIISADEQVLYKNTIPADMINWKKPIEEMVKNIKSFAQAEYLRGLELESYGLKVEMELVPIEVTEKDGNITETKELDPMSKYNEAEGLYHFTANKDHCKLRVKNTSTRKVYFTLLDIQPDNKMQVIIPNKEQGRKPDEYVLEPGEEKILTNSEMLVFSEPYGLEMFKVIVSKTPLDLSSVLISRGTPGSSDPHPFEKLFADTYQEGESETRGAATPSVPMGEVGIYSYTFKIEP